MIRVLVAIVIISTLNACEQTSKPSEQQVPATTIRQKAPGKKDVLIRKFDLSDIPAISKYFKSEVISTLKEYDINSFRKDSCAYLYNYEDMSGGYNGISDTLTMDAFFNTRNLNGNFGTYYKWKGGKEGWLGKDGDELDLKVVGRMRLGLHEGVYAVERFMFNLHYHKHYILIQDSAEQIICITLAEYGPFSGPMQRVAYPIFKEGVLFIVSEESELLVGYYNYYLKTSRERKVEHAIDTKTLRVLSLDSLKIPLD